MISQEVIQTLAAKYQTEAIHVLREYFQHVFLSYFYQQPEAGKIYFKGGTALRILYQSPRFSEDLDFSSSLTNSKVIERAVISTLAEIEREGIQTDIQESKQTTGGYLATVDFKTNGHKISIRLEISFREGKKEGEVATVVSDFLPSYTLVHLAQAQLVNEKIQALLTRGKARDFYDLYFILRANLLPAEKRNIIPAALKALQQSDVRFDRELKQFLPKSHWPLIRDFSSALEQEIKRFL